MSKSIEELEKEIKQKDIEIADLKERLRESLRMKDISENQEIQKFQNDISEFLKLDKADFLKLKDKELDQDIYKFALSMLGRIFKTLKRYGITCE